MSARWPAREDIIADLLEVAESYALDRDNITHPEDIATALITAIEIAWRTVKRVDA